MKSNSKQVRDAAREYLIGCIMSPSYQELSAASDSLPDRLENIKREFRHWYSPYEQHRNRNIQAAFIDWMRGLPSCVPVDFSHYDIRQVVVSWGLADENRIYSDTATDNLFYTIIFSELSKLFTLHNIQL